RCDAYRRLGAYAAVDVTGAFLLVPVGTHDRLPRRKLDAVRLLHVKTELVQPVEPDPGIDAVHLEKRRGFFECNAAAAVADADHRSVDPVGTRFGGRDGVSRRHAQIVVMLDVHVALLSDRLADAAHEDAGRERRRVA